MCVDLNVVLKRQKEKKVNFLVSVWEFLFYEVKAIPRGNIQKKEKKKKKKISHNSVHFPSQSRANRL